jgi:hypothetical protein
MVVPIYLPTSIRVYDIGIGIHIGTGISISIGVSTISFGVEEPAEAYQKCSAD